MTHSAHNFMIPPPRAQTEGERLKEVRLGLGKIEELILIGDARAVTATGVENEDSLTIARERLAAGLGCESKDLQEIVEQFGDDWPQLVLLERVGLGIDSASMRDATWDKLESATMRKLLVLVESDKVTSAMELLAIAKAANQAGRGNRSAGMKNQPPGDVHIGIGIGGQTPGNGVLPAGDLGSIQLTLSHRVRDQLSEVRESRGERVLDSIQMLDLKAIQTAGADGE